ncbi:hypothetical protein CLF_107641 [Clonorchis sinensis]|uniref:G-protein coupled receptors family 1 profile domain-containing protein n=1 Tax=Clonorchis sinensis TaxID=79923 RepID=G7YQW5_CLOSI|nr:hypothetical protein CLF_107641 [Clonorchis sinensis]
MGADQALADANSIYRNICVAYFIILFSLGVVGNTLLLSTLIYKQFQPRHVNTSSRRGTLQVRAPIRFHPRKHRLRFHSTADYLLFLLVFCEFICIWLVLLRYGLHLIADTDLRNFSTFGCKLHVFLSQSAINMTVAMMCIFSAHRMVSMKWPLGTMKRITRRRLNWIIIGSLLSVLLKQLPVFHLFYRDEVGDGVQKCIKSRDPRLSVYINVYSYVEFGTHSALGYTLLVCFNSVLYYTVNRYRRQNRQKSIVGVSKMEDAEITLKKTESRRVRLSASIVIISLSFVQVLSTIPYFLLIELNTRFKLNLVPVEYQFVVYYASIFTVFVNNAINYYLVLSISKKFRQLTWKLILRVFCCKKPELSEDCFGQQQERSGFRSLGSTNQMEKVS